MARNIGGYLAIIPNSLQLKPSVKISDILTTDDPAKNKNPITQRSLRNGVPVFIVSDYPDLLKVKSASDLNG